MHSEKATHSDSTASSATAANPPASMPTVEPATAEPSVSPPGRFSRRQKILALAVIAPLILTASYVVWPHLEVAFNAVSTDDAYVNGHVTFVAPRISGQVSKVLVDDNYRVSKGDLLIQLDPEPYQVIVETKQAAVAAAEADLVAANAQVRALIGQARANRYSLEFAIEQVDNQAAQLRADVATLNSRKAELDLARSNLKRAEKLEPSGAISVEELDVRRQALKVDEANVEKALQTVFAQRVALGLPPQPPAGQELTDVPADLNQNFSTVRQALEQLVQSAAEIGYYPTSWDQTPKQTLDEFYRQDPKGNLDHIFAHIIPQAPMIKQAESKLLQAHRDLEQAELNLRYCDVVSEIDGVVSRRNVNPGNNVQAGESLMVVRSLTEIWIDANFKETQLGRLRIGQPVRCEVDMYGGDHEFEGRITGFSMGSGQTLALLPPQNATGNFVKIVQRLPVRIELVDYDPDKLPLFAGLSVEPHVYYKEPPAGPNAGEFLHAHAPLPQRPPEPTPAGLPAEPPSAADQPNP
jgi:membrane fusion protein, multidrug efflux system